MKKIFLTVLVFFASTSLVFGATNLWQFYDEQGLSLPSFNERKEVFENAISDEIYRGTAEQNEAYLQYLQNDFTENPTVGQPVGQQDLSFGAMAVNSAFPTYTFLNATTSTATSTASSKGDGIVGTAKVTGADKITFVFSRGDTTGTGNSGSSSFNVAVSADGTNWIGYNKLITNVVNSNSQTLTRVSAVSLTGTSTVFTSMDLEHDLINYIRCGTVETTDGEASCKAYAQF